MRISSKSKTRDRKVLDSKLKDLANLKAAKRPQTGWLKTVRTALGLTANQLGLRIGTHNPDVISRLEERELLGTASIQSIEKAAKAMNCRFVYAIVPDDQFPTFEAIVDLQANLAATKLARKVTHSMKLEDQSTMSAAVRSQIDELAAQLKSDLDPALWNLEK